MASIVDVCEILLMASIIYIVDECDILFRTSIVVICEIFFLWHQSLMV